MRLMLTVAILAGALASTQAAAQTAAELAACKADYKKLCPGVAPGGGRVLACLAKQQDKLSPACQKVVQAHSK